MHFLTFVVSTALMAYAVANPVRDIRKALRSVKVLRNSETGSLEVDKNAISCTITAAIQIAACFKSSMYEGPQEHNGDLIASHPMFSIPFGRLVGKESSEEYWDISEENWEISEIFWETIEENWEPSEEESQSQRHFNTGLPLVGFPTACFTTALVDFAKCLAAN